MKPYIAITEHSYGTYGWAMAQLAAGNQVRRFNWPIEVDEYQTRVGSIPVDANNIRIWRVYMIDPTTRCKGFSPGVCGADNDSWGSVGTDSGCYYPSDEDIAATDWQLLTSVTDNQIEILNLLHNRMPRYPNTAQLAFEENLSSYRVETGARVLAFIVLLLVGIAIYWYAHG